MKWRIIAAKILTARFHSKSLQNPLLEYILTCFVLSNPPAQIGPRIKKTKLKKKAYAKPVPKYEVLLSDIRPSSTPTARLFPIINTPEIIENVTALYPVKKTVEAIIRPTK